MSVQLGSLISRHRFSIGVLVLLAILLALVRANFFNWPPGKDVTWYAVYGHELLAGRSLYSDLWEHKPPAIYLSFAAADFVFGYGVATLWIVNYLLGLAIAFGVYHIAARWGQSRWAGICAAVFWVVMAGDVGLETHEPNAEQFINAFLVWACFLLFDPEEKRRKKIVMLVGALIAWASLYKHVVVVIALFWAIGHVLTASDRTARRRAVVDVGILAVIGAAAWGTVFGYFAATGHFQSAWDAIIVFNADYAGSMTGSIINSLSPQSIGSLFGTHVVLIPLCVLAVIHIAGGLVWGDRRRVVCLACWIAGSFIAAVLPGRGYAHYWQLVLPPLAVSAGLFAVAGRSVPRVPAWLTWGLASIALTFMIIREAPAWTTSPNRWLARHGPKTILYVKQLSSQIDWMLEEPESLFVWGADSGFYFHTGKRPPSAGAILPAVNGPFIDEYSKRFLDDLKENPPEMVVVSHSVEVDSKVFFSHPVSVWVRENYRLIDGDYQQRYEFFLLMARKGSELERRLAQ